MKRCLIIIFSIILYSCDFDVENTVNKAIVQDKFYNSPSYQRPESFVLLVKYKDFCFHQYVTSNTFGKYDKGDSVDIVVSSTYVNKKLTEQSFYIIE